VIRVAVNYSPRLSRAEQQLLLLPKRLVNLRPLMRRGILPLYNRMLKRHWDSKGAAFGHQWAPWAASTLAARTRKGNVAMGLLRDTDHLFRTIFKERMSDDRLKVVEGKVRFQGNIAVPYAIYHQVGTQFMPERQVIPDPLPRSFRESVRNVIRTYAASGRLPNNA
jgi:hypothetical protein